MKSPATIVWCAALADGNYCVESRFLKPLNYSLLQTLTDFEPHAPCVSGKPRHVPGLSVFLIRSRTGLRQLVQGDLFAEAEELGIR